MSQDISNKAVLILVVLAVLVSVLSTSLVLTTVYNYNSAPSGQESAEAPSGAVVRLNVANPSSSGVARLTVVNPNQN